MKDKKMRELEYNLQRMFDWLNLPSRTKTQSALKGIVVFGFLFGAILLVSIIEK